MSIRTTFRAAIAMLAVAVGCAEALAQDFPTLKGDSGRTGKNADPNNSGPGPALLTWFHPTMAGDNAGRTIILDNAYLPNPNTDPAFITRLDTWVGVNTEAAPVNIPDPSNLPTGVALQPSPIADYEYAEAVASDKPANLADLDPRVPLSGTLRTFTWTIRNTGSSTDIPPETFYEARNYAIYVHLPVGPTTISGSLRFPQRYYVYEILYAGGTWIEIVDTEASGGGWVRLGNGGLPTNRLFPSDGINPMQVRLYNTVPRDPNTGKLTTNPDPLGGDDLDASLPTPIVYSDAIQAIPHTGTYAATPIVTEIPVTAGTEIRAVAAKNEASLVTIGDEMDNTDVGVTATTPDWVSDNVASGFIGADYLSAPTTNVLGSATTVEYNPQLQGGSPDADGTYEIYAWLPGESNGEAFAQALRYEIHEGTDVTVVTVDQSINRGWFKLGTRRFLNTSSDELKVVVTNYSANAGDVGKEGFTDAIRFVGENLTTLRKGVVRSFIHTSGAIQWTFAPLDESALAINLDNLSAGVTTTGIAWATDNVAANFRGSDYYSATTVNTLGTESTVEYAPQLPGGATAADGTYEIYAWLPGNSNGEIFAPDLRYEIHEGANVTVLTVDQSLARGWVRLGTRRFVHSNASGDELKLVVTNYSAGGVGEAFTDAVRFIGENNLAINSTPVQMTARVRLSQGAAPVDQPVVIVAGEDGRIYCLDAEGRGDGSTDVLWTYPSTPDPDVSPWFDPNLNPANLADADPTNDDWEEIDGVANQRIAEMPTGFGLSSAAVARIGGEDYLFIAANNGRVYCIEVAGRGDFNTALRKPGTTRRIWSYPDDFPGTPQTSELGQALASVAVTETSPGVFTVFVPAAQGRMIALNGTGNLATRTTTTLWSYPLATDPTLGPVATTPAVEFGNVYFGTRSKDGDAPGQFVAVNEDTGALVWSLAGTTRALDDFNGGPATVSGATLGGAMPDTVFVSNDNGGVYALDVTDGSIEWQTYELGAAARAPLTYSMMTVTDVSGVGTATKPTIIVPRSDGVVSMLYAVTGDANARGNRRARGDFFTESSSLTASVGVGRGHMYYADNAGFLYARSAVGGAFPGEQIPGSEGVGENDPAYDDYGDARVKLITKAAFQQLSQGAMYYAGAIDPSINLARNPLAFEWGETIYALVYYFPYKRPGTGLAPVVNVTFTVGGQTIRNVYAVSKKFPDAGMGDTDPNSGYAVLSYTFQQAGPNALPPGSGELAVNFNTTEASGTPVTLPAAQKLTIYIANPLALIIASPSSAYQLIGGLTSVVGPPLTFTTLTDHVENLSNGSAAVPNMRGSVGSVTHGQTGTLQVGVADRSKMALVRQNKGLNNVRVLRSDLGWQPGAIPTEGKGLPKKPIDPILFPGFEDLPGLYPNLSLDYPDLARERVRMTANLLGAAQNPVNYAMELIPPIASDGTPIIEANSDDRWVRTSVVDVFVDVPRFQPANEADLLDANGESVLSGYSGSYTVFVDSTGDGVFNRTSSFIDGDPLNASSAREAYRTFQLSGGVAIDQRLSVQTPILDLGSLASGTGYTPEVPGPANATFDPWSGTYEPLFKEFRVANDGNVNLLNLRLAKAENDGGGIQPYRILSNANEALAFIDTEFDLWSDIDPAYAPSRELTPGLLPLLDSPVILQKSRVGDRFSRELTANPVRRVNPGLGVASEDPRFDDGIYPVGPPRAAVSIPFGFPAGTYSEVLRVIEDDALGSDANNTMVTSAGDAISEPGLRVTFRVKESRLTGSFDLNSPTNYQTAPMVDNYVASGTESFRYSNLQPAGIRHPENGSLVMAWAANRPLWAPPLPAGPVTGEPWRIYVGSVAGAEPTASPGISPLRDLNALTPDVANGRWFVQSGLTPSGFPSVDPERLFDTRAGMGSGNTALVETVRFGSPSFPAAGMLDPFRDPFDVTPEPPFTDALMAFVGESQIQTPTGRKGESKIFVAPVSVDANGAVGIGYTLPPPIGQTPIAMTHDPYAAKGKPSLLQMADGDFLLFYAATAAGQSSIYWTRPSGAALNDVSAYDGSQFMPSVGLDLGAGFESVWSPSVIGRLYRGAVGPVRPIVEILFAGKLRGRPVSEAFMGRLTLEDGAPIGFELLPERTREILSASEPNVFRTLGVQWDRPSGLMLEIERAGVFTDIEVAGSRQVDRETGIVTMKTLLGGTAYLDPTLGSVRLAGGVPGQNATLRLTYTPRLLRTSEGTASGYTSTSLAFDERLIPDPFYWFRPTPDVNFSHPGVDSTDAVRTGRHLYFMGRAAAGVGQAARPMMKTMRFGIDLGAPIYTDPDGSIPTGALDADRFIVAGATSYFQVDPAKGKVYFTADDEDRQIIIEFRAADPATGAKTAGAKTTVEATVTSIVERPEEGVALNQASNETNISAFVDPFDLSGEFEPAIIGTPINRRPGLIWLFWASTRNGSPDLYFQSIAPRFTPVSTGP